MKKVTLHIESLDAGYLVTENGKRNAIADKSALQNLLYTKMQEVTSGIVSAKTSSFSIEFEANPPQQG
jgi:hypothetical protein